MPVIFPILAGGLLVGGTAAAVKYYNSGDADEFYDNLDDTNGSSTVGDNNADNLRI